MRYSKNVSAIDDRRDAQVVCLCGIDDTGVVADAGLHSVRGANPHVRGSFPSNATVTDCAVVVIPVIFSV
ncbi:MAG: hypothetical protein LBD27_06060 [Tannerella sp.]|nr:hypothetical protein [Tannerella sp.]